jgi:hypothetical protein
VSNKERFYTKNLQSFVGYAKRQAAKYGIKGSRLKASKDAIAILNRFHDYDRIDDAWGILEDLQDGEHIKIIEQDPNKVDQIMICSKIFQRTSGVGYVKTILQRFADNYGERAKQAERNEGIDWKAISHAIRAAYQVKELLTDNTITFPRPEAMLLKQIKGGELDYLTIVSPMLEDLMIEVEELSQKSNLPEKVDRSWWDEWMIKWVGDHIQN